MIHFVHVFHYPAGVSRADGEKWYLGTHVPAVRKLPRVRRYLGIACGYDITHAVCRVNDGAVATATVDGAEVRGSDYAESKRGCCSSSGRRQFVQVRAAIAEKNVAGRTHIDHRGREVVRPWGDRSAADRAPARSRAGYRSVKGEICCARGGNGLYPIDGSGFTRSAAAGGYPREGDQLPYTKRVGYGDSYDGGGCRYRSRAQ